MSPSVSRRILISPWLIGGLNGHFLPRLPWKYFRNPLKPSRLTQRWSQDHWLPWLSPKILNRLGRGVLFPRTRQTDNASLVTGYISRPQTPKYWKFPDFSNIVLWVFMQSKLLLWPCHPVFVIKEVQD